MASLIYQELGIDHTNMMTDPQDFVEQVFTAAENLKDIIKEDISVTNYVRKAERTTQFDSTDVDKQLSELYNWVGDNVPTGALGEVADKLRKLAKDIEYMARDRAMDEMANNNERISRALAVELYKFLRVKFNEWLGAMEILEIPVDSPKLPSMPGNYGRPQGLVHYTYLFPGETEGYKVHLSVLKRLNLGYMNLMDTHDYINQHPELGITISEWTN